LQGIMMTAYVDGFSDIKKLPEEAAVALSEIRQRAPLRPRLLRRPDRTFMTIALSARDPLEFQLLVEFAPYSMHVEVVDGNGVAVLVLHDTSSAIALRPDAETKAVIENELPAGLVLD
jgi:hypothetical protein